MSNFSTNMAISETRGQGWIAIPTWRRKLIKQKCVGMSMISLQKTIHTNRCSRWHSDLLLKCLICFVKLDTFVLGNKNFLLCLHQSSLHILQLRLQSTPLLATQPATLTCTRL